jgi:ABC-type multidrug transport system ATPase subunit
VRNSAALSVQADIRLNKYRVDPTNMNVRKLIAFVAQEDSLQVTATAREAIYFFGQATLATVDVERELDADDRRLRARLDCADTKVGGHLKRAFPVENAKRAAIGVELVVKPNLLFLDEPTSGLDSFSAVRLCQVLKKVANAERRFVYHPSAFFALCFL